VSTSVWVVGAGGLLGAALVAKLQRNPDTTVARFPVRWDSAAHSRTDLQAALDAWIATPAERHVLVWAAGAGVTATPATTMFTEFSTFSTFVEAVRGAAKGRRAAQLSIVLASSAGGVYSGSTGAPFDELSPVTAVSDYGRHKLAMETEVRQFAMDTRSRALIARISNLYGPGQNIDKPQGFISQLCKSYLTRYPIRVYVSLDTTRDYLHADDAAELLVACIDRLHAEAEPGETVIKNIASHQPVTLGGIIREARVVFKRRPELVLASSPLAAGQVTDLRISSVVWPELNDIPRRPLIVGIAQTKASLERQLHSTRTAYK